MTYCRINLLTCLITSLSICGASANGDIIFVPVERELNGRILVEGVEAIVEVTQFLPQIGDMGCLSCPPPHIDLIDVPDLFDQIQVPPGFDVEVVDDPTPTPMLVDDPNIANLRLNYFGDSVFGPAKLGIIKFDEFPHEIASLKVVGYGYDKESRKILPNAEIVRFSKSVGDFDDDGRLNHSDVDHLARVISSGKNSSRFDLNGDQSVNQNDLNHWVSDLRGTYIGDSNLDGSFNSGDLVDVFQAGEYEDGIDGNSSWATGDWTGDGEFDTSDLVHAFQDDGYGSNPILTHAVPEPSNIYGSLLTLAILLFRRRP